MWALAGAASTGERQLRHAIGSLAAQVVVERSESVMQRYLQDKAAQGSVPLNRFVALHFPRGVGRWPRDRCGVSAPLTSRAVPHHACVRAVARKRNDEVSFILTELLRLRMIPGLLKTSRRVLGTGNACGCPVEPCP